MGYRETVEKTSHPATFESLRRDFQKLGVKKGDHLLLHASLSAMGYVCGGSSTVLEALMNVLGTEGTLMMPAHSSDNTDPATWRNPPVPESWWPMIRSHSPPFEAGRTPSQSVGVIAETFRTCLERFSSLELTMLQN